MGIRSSKKETVSHDNCSCEMYTACGHCCNMQCFGEIYLERKLEQLEKVLKEHNCEHLTNTIMEYLSKVEIMQFNCLEYHDKYCVYIHSTTAEIWPKLPCVEWRKYAGYRRVKNKSSHNPSLSQVKEIEVVVIGQGGVGKSALVYRWLTDNFLEDIYDPHEDIYIKIISVNGQFIAYSVSDMKEREPSSTHCQIWMRDKMFFLICFAVNDQQTFDEALMWRERILKEKDDGCYGMIFVGTKGDLLYDDEWKDMNEKERYPKKVVDRDAVVEQVSEWNIPYIETSAKEKKNVEFVFQQIFYELWIQTQAQICADQ